MDKESEIEMAIGFSASAAPYSDLGSISVSSYFDFVRISSCPFSLLNLCMDAWSYTSAAPIFCLYYVIYYLYGALIVREDTLVHFSPNVSLICLSWSSSF